MGKPTTFIGSSLEGIEFARGVRRQLASVSEITLWNEGFFETGSTFIEALVNSLARFDFAILLLTPDDLIKSRNDEILGPRDNILFELGLFMGSIGRKRTFMLQQAGENIKLPTDLSGVTTSRYDWPREDKNHEAAVGRPCDEIRNAIMALGISDHRLSNRIQAVSQKQEEQSKEIGRLNELLVKLVVSHHERMHLKGLLSDGPFRVNINSETSSTFQSEIRRLLSLQLIERQPSASVRDFFSHDGERDAKKYFCITNSGREYLKFYDIAELHGLAE
ncbi:nucleotide-binding protein [Methylobacterium currus]|uniref:nucleotide-binding protein n=1 Tax=Methylobacterium currus TaxID=2051553 RepID=UPI001E395A84|nr:nucleotide-binding protein [Methylobacterium currus]UHC14425.1 nucleotide-binding protein [Methylobacterium currus]